MTFDNGNSNEMITAWRFLILQLLMLWLGGFLFYTAVVVPIGTHELGSALEQARITRHVSHVINMIGLAALPVLFIETLLYRRKRPLFFAMLCLWIIMLATVLAMIWMRSRMLPMVDFEARSFPDRAEFYGWHRVYLWTITVMWGAGVSHALLMLAAWRRSDLRRRLP